MIILIIFAISWLWIGWELKHPLRYEDLPDGWTKVETRNTID